MRQHGIAFIKEDAFAGGPFPDSYHSTFHAPWYVLDRWGEVFTVRAYLPEGALGFQDIVLLERRGDDVAPPKPLGRLSPPEAGAGTSPTTPEPTPSRPTTPPSPSSRHLRHRRQ